jgi:hypothetical protein
MAENLGEENISENVLPKETFSFGQIKTNALDEDEDEDEVCEFSLHPTCFSVRQFNC